MNKIIITFVALIAVTLAAPLKGSDAELAEWETFKTTNSKTYPNEEEENFRYNIFLANKQKIETHNKLHENGLVSLKKDLDQYADALLEEIPLPGALPLNTDEWTKYKETHAKTYNENEDKFRKTIYYLKKQEFDDFNKLYEKGIVSWSKGINQFTDHTRNEGPATGLIIPAGERYQTGFIPVETAPDVSARTKRHHEQTHHHGAVVPEHHRGESYDTQHFNHRNIPNQHQEPQYHHGAIPQHQHGHH